MRLNAKVMMKDVPGIGWAGVALTLLAAASVSASVQSALSVKVLPDSANMSSYAVTLAELSAADAACDEAWSEVTSLEALTARARALRESMITAVGGFPETRCPLNARTVSTVARDGYKVEKVLFESWTNVHVTANLFLPDAPAFTPPYPAVILPCGHSDNGKGSDAYQRGCVLAAKAGLACLIYDPYDQGERYQTSPKIGSCAGHNRVGALAALLGGGMARFRIWDGMRAVDYLETRSEIDPARIGCMGNSGGGTMTSLLMAVEPRLKAACPSCYITTFRAVCESIGPQDAEQNIFGQLAFGVNHASFALLQPPMPVRFMFCHGDMFPFAGSKQSWSVVSNVAARCGIAERYGMTDVDGSHGWKESTRTSSVEWLDRWLNDNPDALKHDLAGYRALDNGFSLSAVDTALSGTAHTVCNGGSVLNLPGERTVYDLLRDELRTAESGRSARVSPATVRAVAGISEPELAGVMAVEVSHTTEGEYGIVRERFTWPNGFAVPVVTVTPPDATGVPVLIVGNGSRSDRADLVPAYLAEGRVVILADLIGTGEVGGMKHTFYSSDIPEEEVAVMLYLLGRSLIGEQAGEILAVAREIKSRTGAIPEVVAKERVCIAALHAYASRRDLVARVTQINPPASWTTSVTEGASIPFAQVVNGALRVYDWASLPDVMEPSHATLGLTIRPGVDWRAAEATLSVADLSLPFSDSARLTVTAFDAVGNAVGRRESTVTEAGTVSFSFEGLEAGALYTFRATLMTVETGGASGETVLASCACSEILGRRQTGWIDEDVETLRGPSAARWHYDPADLHAVTADGEAAIGISTGAGAVTFTPDPVSGRSYVIRHRVAFTGPIGTAPVEGTATAKAAVALVPFKGGGCRFALLDNGAWHTNTEVVAAIDATYDVRIIIDPVKRGVSYALVKDGMPIHLHSGTYSADGTNPPERFLYRGNGVIRSIDGEVYTGGVAAVNGVTYDSVGDAVAHADGEAVTLLYDASYAPPETGVFRINAAGYTLVLTGGDYGAFAGWAKRHPEVLDGTRAISAKSAKVSSALDLDGLVSDETLAALQQAGVHITQAVYRCGMVDITLKVDGLPVGEKAEMAYVRKIFGILGSPDGTGPFRQDRIVYAADPVRTGDGAVRFRVRPDGTPAPKAFFFRGNVSL